MSPEDAALLGQLLAGQRLLALGVVADGEPVVGLLPYALAFDSRALYVQSSRLARHSRGLVAGAPWSGVIHEPDSPESDPLQIPRLSLEGTVDPLSEERPEHKVAARTFVARFPSASTTLKLSDFTLHRLEIRSGRLVRGFGRIVNLRLEDFQGLAEPGG